MLTIRVTQLDGFKWWVNDTIFDKSQEDYIRDLTTFTGNAKTRFGQAFHLLLENGERCWDANASAYTVELPRGEGRYSFGRDFAEPILSPYAKYRKCILFEERRAKRFTTYTGEEVLLTGCADMQLADWILDAKTVWSGNKGYDYYASCLQWRAYLEIFGAARFGYKVYEMGMAQYGAELPEQPGSAVPAGAVQLKDVREYEFEHYGPELRQELEYWLSLFVKFIHENGLAAHFTPKQ